MNPNDRKILDRAIGSLSPSRKASVIAALRISGRAGNDSFLARAMNEMVGHSMDLDNAANKTVKISPRARRALEAMNKAIFDLAEILSEEFDFEVRY